MIRKFFLGIALVLGPLVLLSAGTITYVQLDKTEVFYETRGDLEETRVLSKSQSDTSTITHVAFINHRGDTLATAYLRVPRDLARDYHVMQTYAGRRTGETILDVIPDTNDLVLSAIQYPYETPETDQADYLDTLRLLFAPYEVRQAAFKAVGGGMHAVTHLQEQYGIPSERITVVGASLGVFFAPIQVALDQRVPRLLVVHGGGHLPTIWRHILSQEDEWWIPERFVVWFIDTAVGTYDPIHWIGKISPREVHIIGSKNDRYFSEKSIRMLHKRAGKPKTLQWMETGHVGNDDEELINRLVRLVRNYFESLDPEDVPVAEKARPDADQSSR